MLASGWDDLVDVETRLEASRQVRPTENFEPLAASFKRIKNILEASRFPERRPSRSRCWTWSRSRSVPGIYGHSAAVEEQGRRRNYEAALELIASLRPKVDLFFDKVLVNAPDERSAEPADATQ